MSSSYQQSFTIPAGFPALLKDFTREVLRAQPHNLFEFGAEYFAGGQSNIKRGNPAGKPDAPASQPYHKRAEAPTGGAVATAQPAVDVPEAIFEMFRQADVDGNGTLDRREFAAVLRSHGLGLSRRQINRILSEADDNDDGVIQYEEFLPLLMHIVAADEAAATSAAASERLLEGLQADMQELLLYGMPREELEEMMLTVFRGADADGSGTLDRAEFRQCLQTTRLGLSRRDINMLLSKVDLNGDGLVEYEEFVPVCFGIMVERFTDQVLRNQVLASADDLAAFVLQAFQELDREETGQLSARQLKSALRRISDDAAPLTTYQIATLVAAAHVDHQSHTCKYLPLVPAVVNMIRSAVDVDSMKRRFYAIQDLAGSGVMRDLSVRMGADLQAMLHETFERADAGGSGLLTGREICDCIQELASGAGEQLQLQPGVWVSLAMAVDADDDEAVSWGEMVEFLGDVFLNIAREQELDAAEAGAGAAPWDGAGAARGDSMTAMQGTVRLPGMANVEEGKEEGAMERGVRDEAELTMGNTTF